MAININPTPQWGTVNPFGMIPGALDPLTATHAKYSPLGAASRVGTPDPFADLLKVAPNFQGNQNAAWANITNRQKGLVDIPQLQSDAAVRAAMSGMPGFNPGSLGTNAFGRNYGRSVFETQRQGDSDYMALLKFIADTQTVSPELQTQIGTRNADATDRFALAESQGQNRSNELNAAADNQFEFKNSELQNINSQRSNQANPTAEFNRQYELYKENITRTSTLPGAPSAISPGGASGGSSFRAPAQSPAASWAPTPWQTPQVFSGTGGPSSNVWQGGGVVTNQPPSENVLPKLFPGTKEEERVWNDPWANFQNFNFTPQPVNYNDPSFGLSVSGGFGPNIFDEADPDNWWLS